jgi:hypothetical protein
MDQAASEVHPNLYLSLLKTSLNSGFAIRHHPAKVLALVSA